jgi:hypothetical protein
LSVGFRVDAATKAGALPAVRAALVMASHSPIGSSWDVGCEETVLRRHGRKILSPAIGV